MVPECPPRSLGTEVDGCNRRTWVDTLLGLYSTGSCFLNSTNGFTEPNNNKIYLRANRRLKRLVIPRYTCCTPIVKYLHRYYNMTKIPL